MIWCPCTHPHCASASRGICNRVGNCLGTHGLPTSPMSGGLGFWTGGFPVLTTIYLHFSRLGRPLFLKKNFCPFSLPFSLFLLPPPLTFHFLALLHFYPLFFLLFISPFKCQSLCLDCTRLSLVGASTYTDGHLWSMDTLV